ncbi:AfsR/SARP family transcriptional regulator [Dactylosporangium sp. AC04546]|uniref:AfsR/SARP family transcriptional regulator n=1 Tax=Dactylosporangium sp. AC04546 TaxID=2862460 RepID=UPI001EDE1493|nr:AfsR/SARP family transcriptional regulator [Dactylosporangium sp. AC04546]WVK79679.1 AfsR/SARP family transcriptional regulator [Dactylosporangium sp. AC04546]
MDHPGGQLVFGVLGPVTVWSGEEPVHIGEPRRRAVLGTLLLDVGRATPIHRLLNLVWGAQAPATARKALQGYVSQIRRAIGPLPDVTLFTHLDGYRLACQADAVDLHRFRRLVSEAHARSAPSERRTLLEQALALWRGSPFADLAGTGLSAWVAPALAEERMAALDDLFDAELRLGAEARVVGPLRAAVAEHPLRERTAGLLMVALHRCGRSAEAAEMFRQMRRRLIRDTGMEPSAMLAALHRTILAGHPALPPPAHPPATVAAQRDVLDMIGRLSAANLPVLIELGERHLLTGDLDRALACFHAARALARDCGDREHWRQANLGITNARTGRIAQEPDHHDGAARSGRAEHVRR